MREKKYTILFNMESKAYKLYNYLRSTYLLCENNYVCDVCVNVCFSSEKES